jgi:methylated-DNA-[protein]-cysteine S-methyltransferase
MTKSFAFTYYFVPSSLGEVGVVLRADRGSPQRILLPRQGRSMSTLIREAFPGAVEKRGDGDELCRQLRAFLSGMDVDFSLVGLNFEGVSGFARRVLAADHAISRGRVMTYGGLAERLGVPGGGRAVGNVMARNPFPLVIPCHRVVGSGGSLHGFGGGLPMKRALLTMEGIAFDRGGRVLPEHIIQ